MPAVKGCSHEQNALLHVLGQAADACLLVQSLAVVDDGDMATQRPQVPRGIMVQILRLQNGPFPAVILTTIWGIDGSPSAPVALRWQSQDQGCKLILEGSCVQQGSFVQHGRVRASG